MRRETPMASAARSCVSPARQAVQRWHGGTVVQPLHNINGELMANLVATRRQPPRRIVVPPMAYHAGQQRMADEKRRFNVACMGRRFGKSLFGARLSWCVARRLRAVDRDARCGGR